MAFPRFQQYGACKLLFLLHFISSFNLGFGEVLGMNGFCNPFLVDDQVFSDRDFCDTSFRNGLMPQKMCFLG